MYIDPNENYDATPVPGAGTGMSEQERLRNLSPDDPEYWSMAAVQARDGYGSTGINGGQTGNPTVVPGQGGGTANPQPRTYNPMAGWDVNKLNNGGTTTKYNFGRFVQDQGYDPVWARTNLGSIVGAYNGKYGGNARAVGDDKINFGDGFGDVDVLNGGNYWQWGAWNDPNNQQAGAQSGSNSLGSLLGQTSNPTTAPTWTAMQQNSSAYGQSPLATAQRRPNNTLAQLFGGQ